MMATSPSERKYPQRKRVKLTDPFDVDNVMTNPDGPLATMDLKRILAEPESFDLLPEKNREELLGMLPKEHIETNELGQRRPRKRFLTSAEFKHNVGLFQDDVREGRTDPEWLRQAYVASEKRRGGKFDAYLAKEARKDWGINIEALNAERWSNTAIRAADNLDSTAVGGYRQSIDVMMEKPQLGKPLSYPPAPQLIPEPDGLESSPLSTLLSSTPDIE